jgi:hypothetical protein
VKASADGASGCGVLEFLALVLGEFGGDVESDREAGDSADGNLGHFLGDDDGCATEIDFQALGDDSHDCRHASAERGRDQIGRRKGLAVAHIVFGRVGEEGRARVHMLRGAAQLALICDLNFNHFRLKNRDFCVAATRRAKAF